MKLEDALQTTRFESPQHKALLNLIYTAYWYKSQTSTLLKEHGLTVEQFNVLRILKGKHPVAMCVKDIGSRMVEESSNVPRIIDRLILKELVKRSQSATDRRESLISINGKGLEQVARASQALSGFTNQGINLTDEAALALNAALEQLRHPEP